MTNSQPIDMPYQSEYAALLPLFVDLVESQSGKPLPRSKAWLNDAQVLSTKLFRHLVSMNQLAAGTTVRAGTTPEISYIDHASIKVVARALLETYLVFFYLFADNDPQLSKFRHNLWHLGGLADRQRYDVAIADGRDVLDFEKQAIQDLQSEIKNSPFFDSYTKKQKTKLLNGEWRTGISWIALGRNAGFDAGYFKNTYNYLCGYSHSSYASIMQVGEAQSLDDQEMLTRSILGVGLVVMGHFIFTYPIVFPDAAPILAANPLGRQFANQWRFGPTDTAAVPDE